MSDLSVSIIAGGKSSRMGYQKGLAGWKGKTLIEHMLDAVQPLGLPVQIIANDSAFAFFCYRAYPYLISGAGPVGGIYTAMQKSPTENTLILSCDMPLMETAVLTYLIRRHRGSEITLPVIQGRDQPLCAIYSTSIRNDWKDWIDIGERAMYRMLNHFNTNSINMVNLKCIHPKAFTNVNTPDDLKNL